MRKRIIPSVFVLIIMVYTIVFQALHIVVHSHFNQGYELTLAGLHQSCPESSKLCSNTVSANEILAGSIDENRSVIDESTVTDCHEHCPVCDHQFKSYDKPFRFYFPIVLALKKVDQIPYYLAPSVLSPVASVSLRAPPVNRLS